jgi:hypothetical protein
MLCHQRTVRLFIWEKDHCSEGQQTDHRRRGSGNDKYTIKNIAAKTGREVDPLSDLQRQGKFEFLNDQIEYCYRALVGLNNFVLT